MKIRIIKSALLLIPIMAALTSCNNKVQDSTPQYLRGGNSIISDGTNLVIAGYNSTKSKGYDGILLKVNPTTGDTIWTKSFGGSFSDALFNVQRSNDIAGGYIATGFSNNANGGSPSLLIVKTDKDGKTLFSKTYGSGAYTEGFGIVPNADSGYLAVGFIQKSGSNNRDILLLRIDDDGTEMWARSIGKQSTNPYDSINEVAYAAIAAPGGGYFVTGSIKGGPNMEGGQIFLMKVSSTGDSVYWTKTFGTGFGYSLALTKDGGLAISGSILNGMNQNAFLVKTDLAGNLFTGWTAPVQYGGAGYEYGATMIETSDGGYAITGITESVTNGLQDVYFIRTSSLGAITYEKNFGEADTEQGYGLIQTSDNYFYITGLSNTGGSYIYLNKLNMSNVQEAGWPKLIQ